MNNCFSDMKILANEIDELITEYAEFDLSEKRCKSSSPFGNLTLEHCLHILNKMADLQDSMHPWKPTTDNNKKLLLKQILLILEQEKIDIPENIRNLIILNCL